MGEQTKKIKPLSMVCFVLAAILTAASIFFLFFGKLPSETENQKEPVDVYYATEQDEPVWLKMQFMTESVAYLEAVESMQYYITFDCEFNPAVICLYDSELETYQPYIDWLFTDAETGGPEEITVTGYSVPFDEELMQFVMEYFNALVGETAVTEENFADYFGDFYLTTGRSSGSFETFNIGIYCLLGVVAFVIIGVAISYKNLKSVSDAEAANYFEVHKTYKGRGVIGALLGALLGGILWAAIGALGYISSWIGVLIVLFATTGYRLFAKEESGFGTVISVVFSWIVVLPATYFAGVWTFYLELNNYVSEYIPLGRAFLEYGEYLTKTDSWGSMIYNVVISYVFMVVAGAYIASGALKRKQKEEPSITELANANTNANAATEEEKENDQ